jgi:hypothetical protein
MEIAFTRTNEARVTVTVERDDGAVLQTRSPRAAHRLPHDLIHYVVEQELELADGFWGRVANGMTFCNLRVVRQPAQRRRPHREIRRRSSRERNGLEAEVLVGIFDDIWEGTAKREWGSIRRFLDSVWSPRARTRAEELDEHTINRVCAALSETEEAWRRVPPGGELRVSWPSRP